MWRRRALLSACVLLIAAGVAAEGDDEDTGVGNRITPSYVAWDDKDERLIGDAAKNQATLRPAKTVFDVKRLIGRLFSSKSVQHDKKLVPYEIIDEEGKPMIEVKIKGKDTSFSPEQVSAMIP